MVCIEIFTSVSVVTFHLKNNITGQIFLYMACIQVNKVLKLHIGWDAKSDKCFMWSRGSQLLLWYYYLYHYNICLSYNIMHVLV